MKTPASDIQARLLEWADYLARANGYPGAAAFTTQCSEGTFDSRPPRGVEMPRSVSLIIYGMDAAARAGKGQEIEAVRAWYLRDRNRSLDDVADVLGMNANTFRARRKAGEDWLQGWLTACSTVVWRDSTALCGVSS